MTATASRFDAHLDIHELKAEADKAVQDGDRDHCVHLIAKLYCLLDETVAGLEHFLCHDHRAFLEVNVRAS